MILVKFLYIDSAEEVVILFEVDLQKPRNLSPHESEEFRKDSLFSAELKKTRVKGRKVSR
jgi:hypothetical protein